MKKLIFMCTMLMALLSTQTIMAQSEETECISVEQDGSQTLRVWGKGRNRLDAVEQAKKNAVYDVLFKGVTKGNKGYNLRPIITEVNARERYQDYFDIFFLDGGEYLNYISMADRRLGSTKKKVKGSEQVIYCVTVRVLIPELKQRLIQDGVLKTE
ncbi:MAG: hypothetical protein K6A67_00440 [Bacteroidales bacterium]|nr:hypothetical protein [Bacteroidales bacterium]